VADGQERFRSGDKTVRTQAPWECLSERVHCVLGGNPSPYTLNGTCCYLIGSGDSRLLVDCGEQHYGNDEFLRNLSSCMRSTGCTGISGIVVTHLHHDHYGGVYSVQERWGPGIPVYKSHVPDSTFTSLNAIEQRGQLDLFVDTHGVPLWHPKRDVNEPAPEIPLEKLSWLKTELGYGDQNLLDLPKMIPFIWEAREFCRNLESGKLPWVPLSDGMILGVPDGSATLRAIEAPGHSADHFCFMLEEDNALLSGDHVLGQGTSLVGDMADYMVTLERLIGEQPLLLLPGHGPTCSPLVLQRYVVHRRERELQVWQLLLGRKQRGDPGLSAEAVAKHLYTRASGAQLEMAAQNCLKILVGLQREGHVVVHGDSWRVEDLLKRSYTQRSGAVMTEVEWCAVPEPAILQRMSGRAEDIKYWQAKL